MTLHKSLGKDSTGRRENVSGRQLCLGVFVHEADNMIYDGGSQVFALAQESAKRTKRWYEDSDKGRRS